jgi:hypothetical protein
VPPSASRNTQACGAGARQTAAGIRHVPSTTASPSMTACAGQQQPAAQRRRRQAASSASGVTIKLTSGIAMALASGLTSETWPNSSMVSGTSPSVTDHCVRPAIFRAP